MGCSQGQRKRKTACYGHKVKEDSFLKGDRISGSAKFFYKIKGSNPIGSVEVAQGLWCSISIYVTITLFLVTYCIY